MTTAYLPAAGLILNIAYGYNVRDCEDPFIAIAEEATGNTANSGGPGAMMCDMFPLCELTAGVFETWALLTSSSGVSKAHSGVVPICRVQTPCPTHKGACVQDA